MPEAPTTTGRARLRPRGDHGHGGRQPPPGGAPRPEVFPGADGDLLGRPGLPEPSLRSAHKNILH